jgi:bifunctional non-homologous end joining protein LigD
MEWSTPRRPTLLPLDFIEPCQPTVSTKPPIGPNWIHEIKHDGYRLIVCRRGKRVRVFTRRGFDWTPRFPAIVEALNSLRAQSITIDGEGVCCDENGIPNFEKLHSQGHNDSVFLYAFDLLELNGVDYLREPLEARKAKLEALLSKADWGLRFSEHLEGSGEAVFKQGCAMGLEGVICRIDRGEAKAG